jgi:hypothetical protein
MTRPDAVQALVAMILDGLELYDPFHLDGFLRPFSFIDGRTIDSVSVTTGGFTADRGDRNGGFVEMSTASATDDATMDVEVGTLNSRLAYATPTPLGPLLVTGRYWYPEVVSDTIAFASDGLTPALGDVYAKGGLIATPRTVLSAHALLAFDRATLDEPDTLERVDAGSRSGTVWLRHVRSWSDAVTTDTVLSYGSSVGHRDGVADPGDVQVDVRDDRSVRFAGLRADAAWAIDAGSSLRGGIEGRTLAAEMSYGSLAVDRSGLSLAAYAAYRRTLARGLTAEGGLRWDRQEIVDASGVTQIDLSDEWAPRLGVVWDPTADHRSKVFASWGYFYEQIPMDLVIRSFSYERQPRIVNYDPVDVTPNAAAESDFGTPSAILGGFTEPSDPNIKGQYLQEFIVGGEREFFTNWVFGAKGIYRNYERVIEDFLCVDDGTYCIGNPGEGIMKRVFTLDYSTTYPAPKPERTYKGVQLDVTRRMSKNWQMLASYVYSKLDGNFDGEYAPFTNVGADPNISAAYDYYDFFTNGSDLSRITNKGDLSNDRRHQLKVSGTYVTPIKLQIGAYAYWRTGTPLTRYGYSDAYGRYEFFLTERGGAGRQPDDYEVDLHLNYPLEVKKITINFLADIFSVLNAQRPILLDQRWGFTEADNASPTPVNPNYGEAILRTRPRALRLGLRVSF